MKSHLVHSRLTIVSHHPTVNSTVLQDFIIVIIVIITIIIIKIKIVAMTTWEVSAVSLLIGLGGRRGAVGLNVSGHSSSSNS